MTGKKAGLSWYDQSGLSLRHICVPQEVLSLLDLVDILLRAFLAKSVLPVSKTVLSQDDVE